MRLSIHSRIAAIAALVLLTSDGLAAAGGAPTVADIIAGLRASHDRLLRLPGGFLVKYRLEVEQDPKKPEFVFIHGLDGFLAVKWPRLRSTVVGDMAGITVMDPKTRQWSNVVERTLREGNYDFELKTGVAREGVALGQITNFRHGYSAQSCFPLTMQYFSEVCQYFVPGETLTTDYWLPEALNISEYFVGSDAVLGDRACSTIERSDRDRLWISQEIGYGLCQREIRSDSGQVLRERVVNLDFREIAPGVWFPYRQILEMRDPNDGHRMCQLTVAVASLQVGNVTESDLRVVLPKETRRVEDFIQRSVSTNYKSDGDTFESAVNDARHMARSSVASAWVRGSVLWGICLAIGAILLSVAHRRLAAQQR